jgi:hypothetical protein
MHPTRADVLNCCRLPRQLVEPIEPLVEPIEPLVEPIEPLVELSIQKKFPLHRLPLVEPIEPLVEPIEQLVGLVEQPTLHSYFYFLIYPR